MPEIKPDMSDQSRCISVHWSLPVQCVLPCTHRENWHETWHPGTGNRIRYRRSMGIYRTEELSGDEWRSLNIPAPNEQGSVLYDQIRTGIVDADADSPDSAASAAYSVVLPIVATYDIRLTDAEADRDRARDIAVALEQENARQTEQPTDEDYNAAIEQLHTVYGPDAEAFISVIETVRDGEIFHEGPHQEFTVGCVGCLTWRIADALARAVNGGEAL